MPLPKHFPINSPWHLRTFTKLTVIWSHLDSLHCITLTFAYWDLLRFGSWTAILIAERALGCAQWCHHPFVCHRRPVSATICALLLWIRCRLPYVFPSPPPAPHQPSSFCLNSCSPLIASPSPSPAPSRLPCIFAGNNFRHVYRIRLVPEPWQIYRSSNFSDEEEHEQTLVVSFAGSTIVNIQFFCFTKICAVLSRCMLLYKVMCWYSRFLTITWHSCEKVTKAMLGG
jgi:hypothetical protein